MGASKSGRRTKGPWGLRDQMAEDFGVPKEKIKVHIVHCRRRFRRQGVVDRRADRLLFIEGDRGKPVKLVFDYTEELLAGGHRHPAVISLQNRRRGGRDFHGDQSGYLF